MSIKNKSWVQKKKLRQKKVKRAKMRKQMEPKNAAAICTSRYCPVNSVSEETTVPGMKVDSAPQERDPRLKKFHDRTQEQTVLIDPPRRQAQIDEERTNRNRELRRMMDARREEQYKNREQNSFVVQGAAEIAKLKLIVILQKLQQASPPVDYKLLYSYFQDSLKALDQRNVDVSVISNALVEQFAKEDLSNSSSCYAAALKSIDKMKTTNFSAVSEVVSGLDEIVRIVKN